MGLLLFIIAYILYLPLTIINFFVVKNKKGYFKSSAVNLDKFGNREFRTLLNKTLIIKDSDFKFGDIRETISGGLGINFLHNENSPFRVYSGIRLARVARAGSFRPIFGQEVGVDYNLSENWFIGVRGTRDKRYDQELLGWDAETVNSVFVRFGYKWKLKK